MKFSVEPIDESAEGALLVHSLRTGKRTIRKGRILTQDDITLLRVSGYEKATLARLDVEDVPENEAAFRIAKVVIVDKSVKLGTVGTGRVNIYSAVRGLFTCSHTSVDNINMIDEAVTISTIIPYSAVEPGQLIATVKIIPFGVNNLILRNCIDGITSERGLFCVSPYQKFKVALLQTKSQKFEEKLLKKGSEATKSRLKTMGLSLTEQKTCLHDQGAIRQNLLNMAELGFDIVLVLGASAIADRRDVLPAAIVECEGEIVQLGMPVDPGNLTLLARIGKMHVVGLPGSARSPRTHGSDWILQRLAARIKITAQDVRKMGVGGLLKEIPSRPMPRGEASPPKVKKSKNSINFAAVILAAGQSRRMGRRNKLLAEIDSVPMVVLTANAISMANIQKVVVVLGHEAEKVKASLAGLNIEFTHNSNYVEGLSTSLKKGLSKLSDDIDAALICLGDMPRISPLEINQLIDAFAPNEGRVICVPTHKGKHGNPVLIGRRFFAEIQDITGDIGARSLLSTYPDQIHEVEMQSDGVLLDIDTPEALAQITE